MSSSHVELAGRIYAAANITALADDLAAADVELDFSEAFPDGPIVRGIAAYREWRAEAPWAGLINLTVDEILEVDAERVVVLVTAHATGAQSGIDVTARTAHELEFRDGLVVRLKIHPDRDGALRALGLAA